MTSFFSVLIFMFLGHAVDAAKCPKMCVCDGAKLTVACVGKNLTEVPPTVDEVLPRGAFLHAPYLTHLDLRRCNVAQVKEGAFRTLGRLVSLNLAHNNIDILYQESFDGLSSLKELLLDHNRVEEGLQNIQWLRLSHNSINNLASEAFAGLVTLNRLSLDHNELQFFPTQTMTR
ncbi:hypothetical protein CRUP_032872 [Coryphaenoides rupestris]|nr:hypothetical protein CRUP_032872 [Coryphaenoides rupestris]